jgi:hypothetical protein
MLNIWSLLGLVGFALQLLVLKALLGGSWRRYPLVFLYCIVLTVATGIDAYNFILKGGFDSNTYRWWYWINDSVLRALLYFMVIALTYQAMEGHPQRKSVAQVLSALAVVIVGWSVYDAWGPSGFRAGPALTRMSRNLNFTAALLNLVLWSALVRRKERDLQLLLISAGLGIEVTGEAVAHSLRNLVGRGNVDLITLPNLFAVITHLMCLAIWWFALRYSSRQEEPSGAMPPPSEHPAG